MIPGNESILYECHFYPDFKDQLYSKTLTAHISCYTGGDGERASLEVTLPMEISLRFIGELII